MHPAGSFLRDAHISCRFVRANHFPICVHCLVLLGVSLLVLLSLLWQYMEREIPSISAKDKCVFGKEQEGSIRISARPVDGASFASVLLWHLRPLSFRKRKRIACVAQKAGRWARPTICKHDSCLPRPRFRLVALRAGRRAMVLAPAVPNWHPSYVLVLAVATQAKPLLPLCGGRCFRKHTVTMVPHSTLSHQS